MWVCSHTLHAKRCKPACSWYHSRWFGYEVYAVRYRQLCGVTAAGEAHSCWVEESLSCVHRNFCFASPICVQYKRRLQLPPCKMSCATQTASSIWLHLLYTRASCNTTRPLLACPEHCIYQGHQGSWHTAHHVTSTEPPVSTPRCNFPAAANPCTQLWCSFLQSHCVAQQQGARSGGHTHNAMRRAAETHAGESGWNQAQCLHLRTACMLKTAVA